MKRVCDGACGHDQVAPADLEAVARYGHQGHAEKCGGHSQYLDPLRRFSIYDASEHAHHWNGETSQKRRFRSLGVAQPNRLEYVTAKQAKPRQNTAADAH